MAPDGSHLSLTKFFTIVTKIFNHLPKSKVSGFISTDTKVFSFRSNPFGALVKHSWLYFISFFCFHIFSSYPAPGLSEQFFKTLHEQYRMVHVVEKSLNPGKKTT